MVQLSDGITAATKTFFFIYDNLGMSGEIKEKVVMHPLSKIFSKKKFLKTFNIDQSF